MPPEAAELQQRAAVLLAYRRKLLRYFVKCSGSWSHAEDLFSRLTWSILRSPLPAEPAERERFLFRRALNVVFSDRRGERRAERGLGPVRSLDDPAPGAPRGTSLLDVLADPGPGPAVRLAGHDLLEQLESALAELPEADRVLLLALADGASQRRLAATGGVHHATIERRARRARQRLLELLPPDAADEIRGLLG